MLNIHFEIQGIAPYSQSKMLDVKRGKGESYDQMEDRIWRLKAHTADDRDSIMIAGHAIHQALVKGAIKGRLKPVAATSAREGLRNRLETGIMVMGDAETDMKLSKAQCIAINAHSNGKRDSGTRVVRKFPQWPNPWMARFTIAVIDETVVLDDVKQALKWAGLVCGLGRFRPDCMGSNGRFKVTSAKAQQISDDDYLDAA